MPAQIRSLDGYVFPIDPFKVQCGEQEVMCAFACPPRRRCNPGTEQIDECFHPFNQDGRQHPVMTYTVHSLACLADRWRNPTAREKPVIRGYLPYAGGLSPAPEPRRPLWRQTFCDGGTGSRLRFPHTNGSVGNGDDNTTRSVRRDPSSGGGMERLHPA